MHYSSSRGGMVMYNTETLQLAKQFEYIFYGTAFSCE